MIENFARTFISLRHNIHSIVFLGEGQLPRDVYPSNSLVNTVKQQFTRPLAQVDSECIYFIQIVLSELSHGWVLLWVGTKTRGLL
jgi:hypothetical protein